MTLVYEKSARFLVRSTCIAPVMLGSNDDTDSMNVMNVVHVVNTPEGQEDIIKWQDKH